MGRELLQEMMRKYFSDAEQEEASHFSNVCGIPTTSVQELPVSTHKTSWNIVDSPRRLMKTFVFENPAFKKAFLIELLEYEEEVGHSAKITVDADKVIIEVYTHDVDDVTELDKEYASAADDIHEDVKHYNLGAQGDGQYFEI